ncbi:hypothetical protein [Bacillus dakarensis]
MLARVYSSANLTVIFDHFSRLSLLTIWAPRSKLLI